MRIAILSDSHDNIPNIEKVLKWINKERIKTIIHCGDLCAPGLLNKVILHNYAGEIHLVNGNVGDPEQLEKKAKEFKNVHVYNWHYSTSARKMTKNPDVVMGCGEIELDGKRIAFTHSPSIAKELAQTGKYDYVFYGHTHRPWIEEIQSTKHEIPNKSKTQNPNDQNPKKLKSQEAKSCILANPGTLAGMFYKATFAVLDTKTDKLELKILEKL